MTNSSEAKFKNNVLVIGGGVAGLNAALDLAGQGYHVDLVEKNAELGGMVPQLHRLYPLCSCCKVANRVTNVMQHPAVTVHKETEVSEVSGEAGNFQVALNGKNGLQQLKAGAVILASGVETFDPSIYDTYSYSHFPNVITSVEMEWYQKPTGPHQSVPKRPSDGQAPKKVAWLQCVGSREINKCDALFCSSVCCMYALKEASNLKDALPDAETSIFFMDMRTHGKGYEQYMNEAVKKGVRLVRSRIHSIEKEGGTEDLRLSYIDDEGKKQDEVFDLVVLSVGLRPSSQTVELAKKLGVKLTEDLFVRSDHFKPAETNVPGVFVCGGALGPRDVHQSVVEAAAAVGKTAALLKGESAGNGASASFRDVTQEEPSIGVVISLCPSKSSEFDALAGQLKSYVQGLPGVSFVETLDLNDAQGFTQLAGMLKEKNANRLIYASCTPIMHQDLVEWTLRQAGLNPTLYDFVDLRTLGMGGGELDRMKDLFRTSVLRAKLLEPVKMTEVPVQRSALVVGGGVAGMETALAFAAQNVPVTLVEKTDQLGGHAHKVRSTWKGESVRSHLDETIRKVQNNPNIKVLTNAEVVSARGFAGNFTSTVKQNGSTQDIRHGVVVLAPGAHSLKPREYGYGENPSIYRWSDFSKKLMDEPGALNKAGCGVFIQCVGSREPDRPYCSRLCCGFAARSAVDLKTQNPDMDVYILYRDMRTFGEREAVYKEAREKGVIFIRFDADHKPKVNANGNLEVTVKDPILGRELLLKPDFISLQTAIIPENTAALAQLYKVGVNDDGFFKESPAKMRPVDGETEGVYFAGLALAPVPVEEALSEAWAVAGRAMRILDQKTMLVGGAVAEVNPELCAVCLTCVRTCPFSVPFIDSEQGAAYIDPGLCQGCGMCTSECPGKAISFKRLSDDQIVTMSQALFQR